MTYKAFPSGYWNCNLKGRLQKNVLEFSHDGGKALSGRIRTTNNDLKALWYIRQTYEYLDPASV